MSRSSVHAAQLNYERALRKDQRLQFRSDNSPHYEIWVVAGDDNFRAGVNVQSVEGAPRSSPTTTPSTRGTLHKGGLTALASGQHGLRSRRHWSRVARS
jgi:hypothetical protein